LSCHGKVLEKTFLLQEEDSNLHNPLKILYRIVTNPILDSVTNLPRYKKWET
jgi:hypothetical protein